MRGVCHGVECATVLRADIDVAVASSWTFSRKFREGAATEAVAAVRCERRADIFAKV